jgi:nucleoside-diphosphate-sugar epimerase
MVKLVFGCGYLGLRVARLWLQAGDTVFAVTRSPTKAAELAKSGIRPIVGDLLAEEALSLPQDVRSVLFSVGYDRSAGTSIHDVYVGGLSRAIAGLPDSIERFVYISSTGVYGDFAGETVDEESPCQPTRDGGQACLAAEQVLLSSRFARQAIILRLAGLYGPGRIPRSGDLLAGRPIDAPSKGWLNLIHIDDAASIVVLAEQGAQPPRTYVVSDGHPVERGEYYKELARLLRAPPPKFAENAGRLPASQRAASDKRINNSRLMAELQPRLLHPDYHAGLAAIVSAEGSNS